MGNLSENNDLAEELNSNFVKAVLPVTVFVGIEACVGFLGNVLVLCVFSMKYHKCNFKYFVLFLALIDLTSCLTTVPGEMVTQSFWYTYPVPEVCKAKSFFNVFTVCAAALCLLLIAIDRYRKVCKPFGWQVKPEMAIYLSMCAFVIAGIVATPVAIYWGAQHDNVPYRNLTVNVTSCETDEKYKNTKHPLIYTSVTAVIITIPMVVMAVLYFLIAREIRKSKHKTRATRLIAADSVERSVTVPHVSDKEHVKISEVGKMNEDGINDKRNEEKSPETSVSVIDDKGKDRDGYPDKRSENMLPILAKRSTEVEKVMDNNTMDILDLERVHGIKAYKSNHVRTEESDKEISVSTSSDDVRVNLSEGKRKISSRRVNQHIKRKTLIMFILSAVFFITTIIYLTLLSLIASEDNILKNLTMSQKAVYFFFFRLYFIHHVINPFVYVCLDSHVKMTLHEMALKINNKTS